MGFEEDVPRCQWVGEKSSRKFVQEVSVTTTATRKPEHTVAASYLCITIKTHSHTHTHISDEEKFGGTLGIDRVALAGKLSSFPQCVRVCEHWLERLCVWVKWISSKRNVCVSYSVLVGCVFYRDGLLKFC